MRYLLVEVLDDKADALLAHMEHLAAHPASSVISVKMVDEGVIHLPREGV